MNSYTLEGNQRENLSTAIDKLEGVSNNQVNELYNFLRKINKSLTEQSSVDCHIAYNQARVSFIVNNSTVGIIDEEDIDISGYHYIKELLENSVGIDTIVKVKETKDKIRFFTQKNTNQ